MYEQNLNVKNIEDLPNHEQYFPVFINKTLGRFLGEITAVPFTVTLVFLRLQHSPLLLGTAGEGDVLLTGTTSPAVEGVGACPPVEGFGGWPIAEVEVLAAAGSLITALLFKEVSNGYGTL